MNNQAGSFTPMVAVAAVAVFIAIGLSVDGGGRMAALEHADGVAAEAARAGGQELVLSDAIRGTADRIDPAAARTAALNYLHEAGATGTVDVDPAGDRITVIVTVTYDPIMLGLIGAGPWTETGTATAQLLTG